MIILSMWGRGREWYGGKLETILEIVKSVIYASVPLGSELYTLPDCPPKPAKRDHKNSINIVCTSKGYMLRSRL
jgi:hypothetical protein